MGHPGGHRRHLPVFDNVRQRLPPQFIQTDVPVGEHQYVAFALGGAEIARSRHADTGGLDHTPETIGGAVGGSVVHNHDFGARGQRVA
ncbi:MAG: hypothetical protein NTW28_24875 [Candidatus Solibacter sp.]|nr:hypothetical protein [Candidatus Solibacter sp.]